MTLNSMLLSQNALSNMEKNVAEIKIWMRMTNNMVKLTDDKTELFVFGPQSRVSLVISQFLPCC